MLDLPYYFRKGRGEERREEGKTLNQVKALLFEKYTRLFSPE